MRNALHQKFMETVAPYLKVPRKSTLLKDGKITPEEFVAAGDSLVAICPNWSWSAADPQKAMDFLPSDKQYLVNKRVVCASRASDFFDLVADETEVPGFDGWVQSGEGINEVTRPKEESDSGSVDIDDLVVDVDEPEVETPKYRLYDLTIIYDRFYNVPHVFLCGVDATGRPLELREMYQDISAEHAEKTVTYEDNHPFFSGKFLSVHPCEHHGVMLRLIERLERPEAFCAPAYFFLFLKFIHTAIPTVDISTPDLEIADDQ